MPAGRHGSLAQHVFAGASGITDGKLRASAPATRRRRRFALPVNAFKALRGAGFGVVQEAPREMPKPCSGMG
ncbi:hypothetical protein RM96_19210 [Cupriavidus sp. IDO]|nr:hypothetical protein RM96_19210 [Cupriavidus sp. IDO]